MAVCGAHDVGERLGQFVEVVDHLHVVLRRVEIALAQHPQRRHHAVFAFVHPLVEFRRFAVEVAQHLAVLLEDGQQRAVVDAGGGVDRRADHRGDLFDDVFVRDGGRRFGALRLFDEVAVDEHVARQHRQQDQHDGSSVDECQSDDVGDDEAAQRRHEPSRHDGHHARNTVNGRFASPGAVGQRRTHRHHEGDVGGRQRQFERCGHGDQQCRSGEVDRGADHVERCAGVFDVRHFEAAGDRLAEPLGNDPLDGMVGVERRADDGAGEGRRTVFALLLLVVLAGQREFGFGDVHRLARRPEREDHHHARTDEEGEVGRNVLVERIHRHRGVAGVAGDLEGVPAGDRYADEVHQIVSGEGEREGEGAAQDRDAQDVDLETLDEEEDEAAYQPADQ